MGLVEKFGKPRSLKWCCLACESTSLLKGQKAGAIEVLVIKTDFKPVLCSSITHPLQIPSLTNIKCDGKPRSLKWCCLACESTSLLKGQEAGAIEVLDISFSKSRSLSYVFSVLKSIQVFNQARC